jgi:hypothetical protein
MNNENDVAVEKIGELVVPEQFQKEGALKGIENEEKLLERVINQSKSLGKRALPAKDSPDSEWQDFAQKLLDGVADDDYDFADLSELEKGEYLKAFKEAGIHPKQAAKAVGAYKSIVEKTIKAKYSADEFKNKLAEAFKNDADGFEKAKAVLQKAGLLDEINGLSNAEAVKLFQTAAKIGKIYEVKESAAGSAAGNAPVQSPEEKETAFRAELKALGNIARDSENPKVVAILKKYGKIE